MAGVGPTDSIVKRPTITTAAPKSECSTRNSALAVQLLMLMLMLMNVPHIGSDRKRPGNPFATHSAHVEVVALSDAVRDLGRHHLLGMGYGLIGTGYLGPRHAFWGSVPVDHAALLSCH